MNLSVPEIPAAAAAVWPIRPLLGMLRSASWTQLLVPAVVAYLGLCRALRFRRERALRRRFGYPDRASLARMTAEEAQQIVHFLSSWEFPLFNFLALEFGLFKVSFGVRAGQLYRTVLYCTVLYCPVRLLGGVGIANAEAG